MILASSLLIIIGMYSCNNYQMQDLICEHNIFFSVLWRLHKIMLLTSHLMINTHTNFCVYEPTHYQTYRIVKLCKRFRCLLVWLLHIIIYVNKYIYTTYTAKKYIELIYFHSKLYIRTIFYTTTTYLVYLN